MMMSNKMNQEKCPSLTVLSSQKKRNVLKNQTRSTPWYNSFEFYMVGKGLLNALCLFSTSPSSSSSSEKPTKKRKYSSDCSNYEYNVNVNVNTINNYADNTCNYPICMDSNSCFELQQAIDRVSLWRMRIENGRLPHAIDVTSSLAETLFLDAKSQSQQYNHNSKSHDNSFLPLLVSNSTLRNTYATIIIRGVNGIADSMQKNRAMPGSISVANLCSIIQLPSWIVDVRHDSSHNDLPSLFTLRLAAKSLLQFLADKYWNVVYSARTDMYDTAMSLLVQYKLIVDTSVDVIPADDQDINHMNDDDDDDDANSCDSNDNDTNLNYGAYSIFLLQDKKSSTTASSNKSSNKKSKNDKQPKETSNTTNLPVSSSNDDVITPSICIRNFMKSCPMDIGMSTLMSFLLWNGGVTNHQNGEKKDDDSNTENVDGSNLISSSLNQFNDYSGVLIPPETSTLHGGTTLSHLDFLNDIRKIREKYSPLLSTISSIWPGFTHALVVNIVDSIIFLENDYFKSSLHSNMKTNPVLSYLHQYQGIGQKYNHKRSLLFLKSWIDYLVSKEYYSHIGGCYTSLLSQDENIIPKELWKKRFKREKWTTEDWACMESVAPWSILKLSNIPFNSLCDRCILENESLHVQNDSNNCSSSLVLKDVISLFENLLGDDERCEGFGVIDLEYRQIRLRRQKMSCVASNDTTNESTSIYDKNVTNLVSSSVVKNKGVVSEGNYMSLEDMEDLLLDDSSAEEERVEEEKNSKTLVEADNAHLGDEIEPWTLCSSWETCAIGTIPGYP